MQEEPLCIIKINASSRYAGALKDKAIVTYAEPLITKQMKASGSPEG